MKFKFNRSTIIFLAIAIGLILAIEILYRIRPGGSPLLNEFWYTLIRKGGVIAMVAIGLNLIYGFNGQFSLGQWGFYGMGAYAAADVTFRWTQMKTANGLTVLLFVLIFVGLAMFGVAKFVKRVRGLDPLSAFALYLIGVFAGAYLGIQLGSALAGPVTTMLQALPTEFAKQVVFFLAVLMAGALTAEVSYLFGLPVLTLGSDYFGIATLGFTMIVKVLLDNSDTMLGFEEMKGARGMISIPYMSSWLWIGFFLLVIVIITRNLLNSSHGRAVISVREDELAAKLMGIDVTSQKLLTFVIGSLFAGVAGGLYAHIDGFLHPSTFNFIKSFDPMIIIVFGGLGSISGTLVASFGWILTLEGFLRDVLPTGFENWRYVVYPLLLLLMMLLRPSGLLGGFEFPFIKAVLPSLKEKTGAAVKVQPEPNGGEQP
ncbi:MAG: branched-chain amino acid ABC transporter permease [Anaerolineales bacterium]|jgi:branched-chain amino acid transport system permease protein|nr:branched-chain amino acid ABC transporter permease [Anaerolineales bacterium]